MSNRIPAFLNGCLNFVQSRLAQPCLLCRARAPGAPLCADCRADLPRLPAARCPLCALPGTAAVCGACLRTPPPWQRVEAVYAYADPADLLVHALKYRGELAIAGFLADALADEITRRAAPLPDLLLPMPLHPRRLRERGFNQAVHIARHLAGRLDLPLDLAACSRVRDTPPQVSLPRAARRANIRDAFACTPAVAGKRVALIDDVMTSGASLAELARTVRRAGAVEVEAWVVARALRD